MRDEEPGIAGMMMFHVSAAVSLMRMVIENDLVDREVLSAIIEETASESECVREQALWETFADFLDESIDEVVESPALSIVKFPGSDTVQ
jgi:hypothetical protein|tara:strand:- start:1217 stop:1486 length:270 start_codon:yes stop_codon:yes gene_type:complete